MTGETDVSQSRVVLVEGSDGSTNISQSRATIIEGSTASLLSSQARGVIVEGQIDPLLVSQTRSVVVEGPLPQTLFVTQTRAIVIEAPWYERPLQNPIEVQVDYVLPIIPVYWPYQDPKPRLNPEATITITQDIDQTVNVSNNENHTVFVTATRNPAGPLRYQWQYLYSDVWIDITTGGGQTSTLTLFITEEWNNKYIRCIVFDQQNKAQPTVSNAQLMTIV